MKKKICAILIILTLSHCGFKPLYTNENNLDYKIFIQQNEGDRFINNLIVREINKISNSEADKVFKLKIKTNYEKIIISKDSKGSPTEYQLIVKIIFIIDEKEFKKSISFNEKQNIKNIDDVFEQKNYENTIKTNFALSAVRDLNLKLLNKK